MAIKTGKIIGRDVPMVSADTHTDKKVLNMFLLVSIFVYFESYVLPGIVAPWIYHIIPVADFNEFIRPGRDIAFFFIILSCFILGKEVSLRKKTDSFFILLHVFFAATFVSYFFYVINRYPFPPLDRENFLVKILGVFNRTITHLDIRFRLAYFLLSIACHYTLFFAFVENKKFYLRYIFSAVLAFFLGEFANIFRWKSYTFMVGRAEFFLLKLSGFKTVFNYVEGKGPLVGTDLCKAIIVDTCAGFDGMVLFWTAMVMVVLLNKKVLKTRALILTGAGSVVMYLANLLRIHSVLLVGHFSGARATLELWHIYGGILLYIAVIAIILRISYKWLIGGAK